MYLKDLKEINKTAYVRLIEFWSDLSRIGFAESKSDIMLDMNIRYYLEEYNNTFVFTDTYSDDKFEYDLDEEDWKFI
jgi:hypothetical protein